MEALTDQITHPCRGKGGTYRHVSGTKSKGTHSVVFTDSTGGVVRMLGRVRFDHMSWRWLAEVGHIPKIEERVAFDSELAAITWLQARIDFQRLAEPGQPIIRYGGNK